jgi:hypothetical protein
MTTDARRERIARLAALPDELADALGRLSEAQLDAPAEDDPWTIRQVAHHIADSHLNAFVRTKLILTEDHPTLKPYDQDAWAALPDTLSMPVDASLATQRAWTPRRISLAILRGVHARWVALWDSLDEADWSRGAHHPENGAVTLESMLQTYARHGDEHMEQLRRILAGQSRA